MDGVFVSDESLLRFEQIYSADFPGRWACFAQAAIGAVPEAHVAALADLTQAQEAHWLTAAELDTLPKKNRVELILTRSFQPQGGLAAMIRSSLLMADAAAVTPTVAEACAVNEVVREEDPRHDVRRIDTDVLASALASRWERDPRDTAGLDAIARDRGFPEFAAAVDAYRAFYLRELLLLPQIGGAVCG